VLAACIIAVYIRIHMEFRMSYSYLEFECSLEIC
jgi:hypothetical protein